MGKNGQAQSTAKQRKRHQETPPSRADIERTLSSAAYAAHLGSEQAVNQHLDALQEVDSRYPGLLGQIAVPWVERALRTVWESGWQPVDLAELARRKLDPDVQKILPDTIAAEHRRYSAATTDGRWHDQLAAIGVIEQPAVDGDSSQLARWEDAWGTSRWRALRMLIALAAFLLTLPRLPRLLPIPGDSAARVASSKPADVDGKILARIRGLLAKAESTDFPEEAEALSSKAQEMMSKYSLDRALLDAEASDPAGGALGRRIWVDAPYVSAKNHLVQVVASANGCKAVSYDQLGFVTILGAEVDLRLVEVLSTSLLVQASRAMLRTKSQVDRRGQSRTRSYRQSFLLSYAARIGERLREASEVSKASIDDADRERLLPVLARRNDQVDALFAELFPHVVTRRTSVSNSAGWAAGRAAADQASLNARRPVQQ